MATKRTPPRAGKIRGHVTELRNRLDRDRLQREAAGKEPQSRILEIGDVRGGYDANRALITTLGGQRRTLAMPDLARFRANMATVQARIRKGITAQQVIDLASTHALPYSGGKPAGGDLSKAKTEIHVALPVSALAMNGGLETRWQVDASGDDPKIKHHYVLVRFLEWGDQLRHLQATPLDSQEAKAEKAFTPKQAVRALRAGYLQFDCDCGRHRYYFRFVASIGGFAAGRIESGYPKIRNPDLQGVACKHVLRVMREVVSGLFVGNFLERALNKAMLTGGRVNHTTQQADADAQAARLAKRPAPIKTSADRKDDSERRKLVRAMKFVTPRTKPVALSKAKQRQLISIAESLGLAPAEAMRRLLTP